MGRTEEIRARHFGKLHVWEDAEAHGQAIRDINFLLSRVERLEQGLRMVAAKGDDPTCDCGDCLCTRAVRKVALSYLKEADDGE